MTMPTLNASIVRFKKSVSRLKYERQPSLTSFIGICCTTTSFAGTLAYKEDIRLIYSAGRGASAPLFVAKVLNLLRLPL